MKWIVSVIMISTLVIWGISTSVFAKEGFYLGAGIPYNTIGGDFKGDTFLVGPSDIIIQPEIDGGFGFGIVAGYGFNNELSLELSYLVSSHDAEFIGESVDVKYSVFNIDLKYSFLTSQATQPYLLVGVGFPKLVVEDGSETRSFLPFRVGDAEYTGVGWNLGVGVDHYVTPNVSIGAGATYRIVKYDEAEGVVGSGEIGDSLKGNGFGLMLGAAYHF